MPLAGSPAAGERKTHPELADVFRRYGERFKQTHRLSAAQHKVMRAVKACRTEVLGGHLYRCDACDYERPLYNSYPPLAIVLLTLRPTRRHGFALQSP